MPSLNRAWIGIVPMFILLALSSGCTLKATLDTTSDTVSNFLSSTSGRSWLTEDGLVKDDMKTRVFVAANWPNLQQDIARSQGEYLSSYERLLGVADAHRDSFRRTTIDHLRLLDRPGLSLLTFTETMSATAEQLQAGFPRRTP